MFFSGGQPATSLISILPFRIYCFIGTPTFRGLRGFISLGNGEGGARLSRGPLNDTKFPPGGPYRPF